MRRSRTRRSARRSCSQLFGGGGGDDNNDSDEGAGDDDLDGDGVGDDGVNETLDAGVLDDGIEGVVGSVPGALLIIAAVGAFVFSPGCATTLQARSRRP